MCWLVETSNHFYVCAYNPCGGWGLKTLFSLSQQEESDDRPPQSCRNGNASCFDRQNKCLSIKVWESGKKTKQLSHCRLKIWKEWVVKHIYIFYDIFQELFKGHLQNANWKNIYFKNNYFLFTISWKLRWVDVECLSPPVTFYVEYSLPLHCTSMSCFTVCCEWSRAKHRPVSWWLLGHLSYMRWAHRDQELLKLNYILYVYSEHLCITLLLQIFLS